ncbi:MAG: dihydrolipoamide acetyltransferase family protein [Leifsonia sp.]
MIDILMPRLSDTMTEGAIAAWHKKPGDIVSPGDVLVEIETDKALMEQEAYDGGTLTEILVREGENVAIGTPIARLDDGVDHGMSGPQAAPVHASEALAPAESATPPVPPRSGNMERLRATPVVRRLAKERGIDLTAMTGSGPGGRIVRADLEAAGDLAGQSSLPEAESPEGTEPSGDSRDEFDRIPFDAIRRSIATRLAESAATVPVFQATSSADVTELLALRATVNAATVSSGTKISVNDLVVKAVALALREHPAINASYSPEAGGQTLLHRRVNIGVAVDAPAGLVVPVLRDADEASISAISLQTRALAARAADRTLTVAEMSGGTFTVSNLGMFGVEHFTAILNPPQGAILAVGSSRDTVTIREGEVVARTRLTYTLTCDHRIIDGAAAGRFLSTLTSLFETPFRLLL